MIFPQLRLQQITVYEHEILFDHDILLLLRSLPTSYRRQRRLNEEDSLFELLEGKKCIIKFLKALFST